MAPIADLPHAIFGEISPNEIGLDQKSKAESGDPNDLDPGQPSMDDPVGLGFGAWARPLGRLKYYLAKIRLDVLRWKDGKKHRTEVGFIKLAVDELFDNDGHPVPMIAFFLTENDEDSSDQAEQPVLTLTRKGIRIHVPIVEGGIGAAPGRVTRFYTDGGKFAINWQDDTGEPSGIIYATKGTTDESQWVAIGKVPLELWPQ